MIKWFHFDYFEYSMSITKEVNLKFLNWLKNRTTMNINLIMKNFLYLSFIMAFQ